jgi:MYXO-CTERM domain-containing protein
VAVGFVFDGVIRADGSMDGYRTERIANLEPSVSLVVVGEDYLTGDTSQSCTWRSEFDVPLAACDLPNTDGADTWNSYLGRLSLGWEDTDCDVRLDEDAFFRLRAAFDGAALGLSFGPMTPDLESAWPEDALQAYGHAMSAMYVSIVDANGDFVGDDWSTGVSFAWDPVTREIVDPGNGIGVPVEASTSGATLDEAYLTSAAISFVEIAQLDVSRLDDAVDACPPEHTGLGEHSAEEHTGTLAEHSGDELPEPTDGGSDDETDTPDQEDPQGCGCASSGSPAGGVLLAAGLLALRRRRSGG